MRALYALVILGTICLTSCEQWQSKELDHQGIVVAQVGARYLYAAELNNVIHPAVNEQDSAGLAQSYINQWIRDQLMMQEASMALSTDLDIEQLVDDYREKLIKFNFENKIIAERYDTVVTVEELSAFYEENKEQFVLAEPIFRVMYAKVPNSAKGISKFYRNWRNNKEEQTTKYINQNAVDQKMNDALWYNWSDIEEWTDRFSLSRAQRITDQHVTDGDNEYFLKVKEYKEERSISPQAYIKNQLIQMILHNRKRAIIEDYKTELYNKAIKNNQVQIL